MRIGNAEGAFTHFELASAATFSLPSPSAPWQPAQLLAYSVLPDSNRFCSRRSTVPAAASSATGLPVQLISRDPRQLRPRDRRRRQLRQRHRFGGQRHALTRRDLRAIAPGRREPGRAHLAATTCRLRRGQRRAETGQQRAPLPRRTLGVGRRVERELHERHIAALRERGGQDRDAVFRSLRARGLNDLLQHFGFDALQAADQRRRR